jgi:hypothetical protein
LNSVVWTQQSELTATTDGAAGDMFGASVAVSGSVAIVGAPNHASGEGVAYVWVQSGSTWTLAQELSAKDGAKGDGFGSSVAVSGGIAVVGAPSHTVGGHTAAGAAYVFVQSGSAWTEASELTAGDAAASDGFGTSVAVSGTTAVVGAPFHAASGHSEAGAAYVFAQSAGTWSQQAELTASDGKVADLFGFSVSVSGGTAIVGAYAHQVGSNAQAGAAYAFTESAGTWTEQQELTASDGASKDLFGASVAASGDLVIVGALQHKVGMLSQAGAAYVFGGGAGGTTIPAPAMGTAALACCALLLAVAGVLAVPRRRV